ncbi:MAG: hypothetical protein GY835_00200 [bacterium]|nr:hypothetical protein [bacterium]
MSLSTGKGRLVLVLMMAVCIVAGCGTPPPCNVDSAQVEQARGEYEAAKVKSDSQAAEVEALEARLATISVDVVSDAELAEMKQRLEELKKGSGR